MRVYSTNDSAEECSLIHTILVALHWSVCAELDLDANVFTERLIRFLHTMLVTLCTN